MDHWEGGGDADMIICSPLAGPVSACSFLCVFGSLDLSAATKTYLLACKGFERVVSLWRPASTLRFNGMSAVPRIAFCLEGKGLLGV